MELLGERCFFFPMVFCFFQWNLDPLHPPNFDGWLMLHPPKVDRDRTHLKPWKWQKKPWSLKTCPKDKAGPNQPHSVPTFWHLIEYFLLGLLGGHCWTCWQGQTFLEVIEVQSYRNPCVEFSRFFPLSKLQNCLVVWNMNGLFFHEFITFRSVGNVVIPTDEVIFFRMIHLHPSWVVSEVIPDDVWKFLSRMTHGNAELTNTNGDLTNVNSCLSH